MSEPVVCRLCGWPKWAHVPWDWFPEEQVERAVTDTGPEEE